MSGLSFLDAAKHRTPLPLQPAITEKVDLNTQAVQLVKEAIKRQMPKETALVFPQQTSKLSSSVNPEPSPVHPQISNVSLFDEEALMDDSEYAPGGSSLLGKVQANEKVHFKNLLTKIQEENHRIVVLVGPAGSGKTTCSIRLAKEFNKEPINLCFRLEFKRINFRDKLTLKELLLKYLHLESILPAEESFDLGDEKQSVEDVIKSIIDKTYLQIVGNKKNVLLIFDGYDQFEKKIDKVPPHLHHMDEMYIKDLVAGLCNRDLLPDCHLVLTSRSHALSSLPDDIKNKTTTYLVQDMIDEDMKKLLHTLAGKKVKDLLLDILETKAPNLKALCHNPLLLQMYVAAAFTKNPQYFTSMTRVFKSVLEKLRKSKQLLGKPLSEEVLKSLSVVAFQAIINGSVLICKELLKVNNLNPEQVQGFVFLVSGCNNYENLIDGEHQLFFSHQNLQEYFAARYMWKYATDDEFDDFVQNKLCDEYWLVVAQFLCGMIVDLNKKEGKATKRDIIITTRLKKEMDEWRSSQDLLNLCVLLRECQDKDVTAEIALSFPTDFKMHINTSSEGHALGCLVKACDRIEKILLHGYSPSFVCFLKEVQQMDRQIGVLTLINQQKASSDFFKAAMEVLPSIKHVLNMEGWFLNEDEDFTVHMIEEFQKCINALGGNENRKVVFTEHFDSWKLKHKFNFEELSKKLRQDYQVEMDEQSFGKMITITLTYQNS